MNAVAPTRSTVLIFYAAESKPFDYNPHEEIQALLSRAEDAFQITTNRHLMSLFTEGGQELPDQSKVGADGVEPGQKLILRQSTVKGG
jgi:hypothetical protein